MLVRSSRRQAGLGCGLSKTRPRLHSSVWAKYRPDWRLTQHFTSEIEITFLRSSEEGEGGGMQVIHCLVWQARQSYGPRSTLHWVIPLSTSDPANAEEPGCSWVGVFHWNCSTFVLFVLIIHCIIYVYVYVYNSTLHIHVHMYVYVYTLCNTHHTV